MDKMDKALAALVIIAAAIGLAVVFALAVLLIRAGFLLII